MSFQSLLNTGLILQLMRLKEVDISAYDSEQSHLRDMSHVFMESTEIFPPLPPLSVPPIEPGKAKA